MIEIEDAGASGQTIKFSYKSQPQAKQTKTPIRVGRSPMAKGDSIERNLDGESSPGPHTLLNSFPHAPLTKPSVWPLPWY